MKIINSTEKITNQTLAEMSSRMFGNLVKAVVDVENEIMAVDAEMHSDLEAELIESGSGQRNLWGINLYPEFFGEEDFVEFNSMINLRPSQNNRTRGVDDKQIQEKIRKIVGALVEK